MTQQPEPQPGEETHQAAPPPGAAGAGVAADTGPDDVADLQTQLAERTADLQRLQAEYVNYKRRVDRDRGLVRDTATVAALMALLPVLDDIDRAREHGELTGGFKAVAESLERTVAGLGLVRFGEPGESFDPRVHEALMHELSADVDEPTAQAILQPGYRIAERVVRPARVAVAEPLTTVAGVTLDEAEVPAGPGPVDAEVAGPDLAEDAIDAPGVAVSDQPPAEASADPPADEAAPADEHGEGRDETSRT